MDSDPSPELTSWYTIFSERWDCRLLGCSMLDPPHKHGRLDPKEWHAMTDVNTELV